MGPNGRRIIAAIALVAGLNFVQGEEEIEVIRCPTVKSIDFSAEIEIDDPNVARAWNELSGLAASPSQLAPSGAPIMWGHNDGRDQGNFGTNIGAWDPVTGERLMTFQLPFDEDSLPPIVNQDWEDMTIGSCGKTGLKDTCIYLADLGDNLASGTINDTLRPDDRPYRIYKFPEPILADFAMERNANRLATYPTNLVTALEIKFSHSSSPAKTANIEGVFLDHTGWGFGGAIGDMYLVSKSRTWGRLYKIPANAWPTQTDKSRVYAPAVAGTNYVDGEFPRFLWTSGDMSLDGTKIIMGTINRNYVFLRCPGMSVADAVVGLDACMIWENPREAADNKRQFEAVSWYPDESTVLNIAESQTTIPRIVRVSMDYSNPPDHCPTVEFQTVDGVQKCQTTRNAYSDTNFVSETKPYEWCEDALSYYSTSEPTMSPSLSAAPSRKPTSPKPSILPTTASPTNIAEATSVDFAPDGAVSVKGVTTIVTILSVLVSSLVLA